MSTYLAATEATFVLPAPVPTITASSQPLSLGEIASWCDEIGAEVDAAAQAAGYAVPVPASAGAYAQVRRIVRTGVLAEILGVLAPNVPGPGGKLTLASEYRRDYDETLRLIREGKLPLVGAAVAAGGAGRELPRSFETSNPGATIGGASPILSTRQEW